MGCNGRSFKALFGVLLALLGFIWFFLVGFTEATAILIPRPAGSFKHITERGGKKSGVHQVTDLNYMSKRKVPNGPDPIHNRRAGNSGRPPGQA
ncbi:unnamed protein product [Ilex paraguariensis]|uniref:CLAVATA3/ESR (CLE)-related protein 25 n=1 Tax=Ilex paraguariensis TaxID=185542 RepID=A0ABC8SIP1_9AQUA